MPERNPSARGEPDVQQDDVDHDVALVVGERLTCDELTGDLIIPSNTQRELQKLAC